MAGFSFARARCQCIVSYDVTLDANRHSSNEDAAMFTRKRHFQSSAALAIAIASSLTTLPVAAADFPAGAYSGEQFTLAFDGHGHFRGSIKGATKVEGEYTVDGDQVQFTDKSGAWACTQTGEKTGTYRWKSADGMLSLTKVSDACKDRAGSLIGHPWKKQG
jgi:hypothetical protein